jgi:hypothetical protein
MSIPKPILTFAVGVTGHRSARLANTDRKRIEQQLADVFSNIEEQCQAELDRRKKERLYAEPTPRINLLSSLADGADALAVRLRPSTWTSIGILPYPQERNIEMLRSSTPSENVQQALAEYSAAREASQQIIVLPQTRPQDTNGFVRARDLMLRQIDLLIAIWDGRVQENAGGTMDVVAHALENGIPVVWIATEKKQSPWVISHVEDANRETPYANATSGPIADAVLSQLGLRERRAALREPWALEATSASAQTRLHDFLHEAVPTRCYWMAYDCIKIGLRPWRWRFTKKLGGTEDVRKSWAPFLSALSGNEDFGKKIQDTLLPRFAAVDALANYYGRKYRSAYVLAYFLSVCAVATALFHFVFPHGKWIELGLASTELLFVGLIIGIVLAGRTKRWHDRWLDYRALAEMLRHLRFLGLLGQYENRAYAEAAARPGASWVLWYLRATMRELGPPSGDLGPEYQRKVLAALVSSELTPQIEYHTDNVAALRRLHHQLHSLGNLCFFAAAGILAGFIVLLFIQDICQSCLLDEAQFRRLGSIVALITAFLPALGAAFAGIRFTGDFDGFAERSAETGAELDLLRERYDLAIDRLDFDFTAHVLFDTARIMAVDINGWASLYSRKGLILPG